MDPKLTGLSVNNLGPQTSYPIPEGVLNHQGVNYIAITLWALDAGGAALSGISLEPTATILSGYGGVAPAEQPRYSPRHGAY